MLEPLTLEKLHLYDQGSLSVLYDRGMRAVFLDLEDRPRLQKGRKIVIEMEFKPDDLGEDLIDVHCTAKVKVSIPDKEARTNVLAPSRKHGALMFNPDCARAAQATLPFDAEDEEAAE